MAEGSGAVVSRAAIRSVELPRIDVRARFHQSESDKHHADHEDAERAAEHETNSDGHDHDTAGEQRFLHTSRASPADKSLVRIRSMTLDARPIPDCYLNRLYTSVSRFIIRVPRSKL
ncbi:hypothetical protein [Haladaptatus halobius]|uniref:hypothetical protein n=1 Tax=Haladaptatus halobius TaxID=2884875 RepID=UPI001D0A2D55|nr:hypothetical protein [Haladaptatus halobius]